MEKTMVRSADVFVVGAGMAGLRAAREAVHNGSRVIVAMKGKRSASREIMGFCAPVSPADSYELFAGDLKRSGCGINNEQLIDTLVHESRKQVTEFEKMGFVFDTKNGEYHLQSPLGSSVPRIVHQEALTGTRLMDLLYADCAENGVEFLDDFTVLDLLVDDNTVIGAIGIDRKEGCFVAVKAKAVVLATGGCSDIYPISTYPKGIAGDGYAMAYRAGAELVDMEFQQYEPCCAIYPDTVLGDVVCTTMLRLGAKLTNAAGEDLIEKHGLSLSRLQKDTLSKAIAKEIASGVCSEHGGVLFDATVLPEKVVVVEHNVFYDPLKAGGVDLTKEAVEVAPVAHTTLGGIAIRPDTSCGVKGLFAAGEVIGGLHGANRIGGCAGAETVSFGAIAGTSASDYAKAAQFADSFDSVLEKDVLCREACFGEDEHDMINSLNKRLSALVGKALGLFKNDADLESAVKELAVLCEQLSAAKVSDMSAAEALFSLKNKLCAAEMQLLSALSRKESRGGFFRTDYPEQSETKYNNFIKKVDNVMTLEKRTVGVVGRE